MKDAEKALLNLRKTGWNTKKVAEEFGISESVVRMYLNGERKIPKKYIPLIPDEKFSGDTHLKSRIKKEQRINELKKYSIEVFKRKKTIFTYIVDIFLCCTERLAYLWRQRYMEFLR